jgi:hypothetical protein
MAATPTIDRRTSRSVRPSTCTWSKITLDNSYPTGGYALDFPANTQIERLSFPNVGGYSSSGFARRRS